MAPSTFQRKATKYESTNLTWKSKYQIEPNLVQILMAIVPTIKNLHAWGPEPWLKFIRRCKRSRVKLSQPKTRVQDQREDLGR